MSDKRIVHSTKDTSVWNWNSTLTPSKPRSRVQALRDQNDPRPSVDVKLERALLDIQLREVTVLGIPINLAPVLPARLDRVG